VNADADDIALRLEAAEYADAKVCELPKCSNVLISYAWLAAFDAFVAART
jgi:hypothetical protein